MLHYMISLGSAWLQIAHCNFVTKQNWKRWSLSWPELNTFWPMTRHWFVFKKIIWHLYFLRVHCDFNSDRVQQIFWPVFQFLSFEESESKILSHFFFLYFFSGDFQSLTETQKMKVEWGRDWLGLRQRLRKRKRVRVREWEWRNKNESMVIFLMLFTR